MTPDRELEGIKRFTQDEMDGQFHRGFLFGMLSLVALIMLVVAAISMLATVR